MPTDSRGRTYFRKLFFKKVTSSRETFPLAEGDIALDEDDGKLYRGDGSTVGGILIQSTAGISLTDISSATTAPSGGGALVYNNTNGQITYTPPDLSGLGGSSLTIQDEGSALSTAATTLNFVGAGVTATGTGATKTITIAGGGGGGLSNVVEDTTPQLGGDLDGQAFNITTTGKILYSNLYATEGDLPNATTYHGMFAHVHATGAGYFAHGGAWIKLANDSQLSSYQTTAGLNSAIDSHLNQSGPTSGHVLSWNGSDYAWVANSGGGGISNLVEDTTPQLGGNLDVNGNSITSSGDLTLDVSGDIVLDAGGEQIIFKDGSTNVGHIDLTDDDLIIKSLVSDADIVFKGNDNGTERTPFYLDMSVGGTAMFNAGIKNTNFFWNTTDNIVAFQAGASGEIALTHVHNTGFKLTNSGTGTPAVELQFVDSDEAVGSDGTNLLLKSGGTTFKIPTADGTSGQVLQTDGNGVLSFTTVSGGGGGLANVVDDTTPQLGGDLDTNSSDILLLNNRIKYNAAGGSMLDFTVTQYSVANNTVLSSVGSINLFLDSTSADTSGDTAFRIFDTTNPDGTFNENTNIFKIADSGNVTVTGTLNGHTIPGGAGTIALTSDITGSGISNVVEDTTPQLGGDLDTNGNKITFADSVNAEFGNDGDLKIFHNGGHSIVRETGTGSLYLQSDNNVILSTDSSTKVMVKGIANGATELYHNDVLKLNTSSSGVTIVDELHTEGATPHLTLKRTDNANVPTLRFKGSGGTIGASIDFQGTSGTSNELAFQVYDGASIAERFRVTYTGAKVTGNLNLTSGVHEKFATLTGSTGTVAHDCSTGHVFYHTGVAANFTANFTNLGLAQEDATNIAIIINQGNTGYIPSAVQIGGAAQTIIWNGNSTPSATDNGTDVFSFTILNDGGTYVVLGQMVSFGGV